MRLKDLVDPKHNLAAVALLVRRADVDIQFYDHEELEALAQAGDLLDLARVAALAKAIQDPVAILSKFDGGAHCRARTKAMAYAASEAGRAS